MKKCKEEFLNIITYQDYSNQETDMIDKRVFHTLAGEYIKNKIYFFSIDNNSICKIDMETGHIEVEYGDYERPFCKEYLYTNSIVYKQIIYFIPNRSNDILKYDTITNEKVRISHKGNSIDYEPVIYANKLFLLPIGYSNELICININNNSVSYLPSNYNYQLNQKFIGEHFIFGKALKIGNYVYRGSYLEPCIQKFNIKTKTFEYIKIKNFNRSIRSISFDGDYFWILSNIDGLIVRWEETTNKIVYSLDLSSETQKKEMLYSSCVYSSGIVYIPEKKGTCLLELYVKENVLYIYDCKKISGFALKQDNMQMFADQIRVGNEGSLYFFPFFANGVVIKRKNGTVYFYNTTTAKGLTIANDQIIQNESSSTLKYFCHKLHTKFKRTESKEKIGQHILDNICKCIK